MAKTFSNIGEPSSLVVQLLPQEAAKYFYLSICSEYFYSEEMTQIIKANDQHLVKFEDLLTEFINNELTEHSDIKALRQLLLSWVEKLQD